MNRHPLEGVSGKCYVCLWNRAGSPLESGISLNQRGWAGAWMGASCHLPVLLSLPPPTRVSLIVFGFVYDNGRLCNIHLLASYRGLGTVVNSSLSRQVSSRPQEAVKQNSHTAPFCTRARAGGCMVTSVSWISVLVAHNTSTSCAYIETRCVFLNIAHCLN